MIDWKAVITTLVASTTISAIILAVLGFIAKSIFTQFLSRDIEKFKSDHELELERFRSDLQKSAVEHQVRYHSLHVKRAEVIAELYGLLVQAEHDAVTLANPFQGAGEPSQVEKSKEAFKSGKAFYDYFERNKIYFKKESCERISNFIQGLNHSLIDFDFVLDALNHQYDAKERTKEWAKVWEKLTKELAQIKAEIEEEFREILGL